VAVTVISVEALAPREFRVQVRAGDAETTHIVGIPGDFAARYALPAVAPEVLVERSFEFLLEREPPGSILERFTLDEISRYFPVYPGEIARRLS
jgi:hypothetical protein